MNCFYETLLLRQLTETFACHRFVSVIASVFCISLLDLQKLNIAILKGALDFCQRLLCETKHFYQLVPIPIFKINEQSNKVIKC